MRTLIDPVILQIARVDLAGMHRVSLGGRAWRLSMGCVLCLMRLRLKYTGEPATVTLTVCAVLSDLETRQWQMLSSICMMLQGSRSICT